MEATTPPTNIKQLAESPNHSFIPSYYVHSTNINNHSDDDGDDSNLIPVVDFSLLTSHDPHQRSTAVHHLGQACQDWGFFMVVNHDIPENLMKAVIDSTNEFFNLPEEEKQEFSGKHVLDPIRYGTSFNTCKETVFFWRDYLKVFVHPHFHSPPKPQLYRDIMCEYSEKSRGVARKLLGGISESLGLEESVLDKALDFEHSGLQLFVGNYYPPCPQPQLTMGMPPHSDHGLLTLLIHNQVGGLQVLHQDKWINVNSLPNSLLVNTGDHLEILSNGKYKSNMHRAVVNNEVTRISVVTAHGPSLETIVRPASPLIEKENSPSAYIPMKYKDYLEMQQSNQLDAKTCLERLKIPTN